MMKNLFQKLFGLNRLEVVDGGYERQITQTSAAQISKPPAPRELEDLLRETYRFVAVDVETANRNQSSICQIGMALVSADGTIDTIGILIDPEQHFENFNVDLHGIDDETVRGAQTFELALQSLRPFLERHILIQHSNFDKQAFNAACAAYDIPILRAKWLDSVQIARRAWPELKGNGGHGLANLKDHLNLKFEHHDAEEDARAAAEVTLLAEGKTGQSFSELSETKKKQHKYQPSLAVEGNQQGALYGHVACFTGQLAMSRVEAATFAAGAGITVRTSVSKKVTLLVVGDQDMTLLAGHDKSTKHQRAEELMEEGHEIKIVGESEFMTLVSSKLGS
jgi:DNA polymerase-3 subunit epsilon